MGGERRVCPKDVAACLQLGLERDWVILKDCAKHLAANIEKKCDCM